MIKLWKIKPVLKIYYENKIYFENILLKVPNATKYWFHGGAILGTYLFVFYEIERIVIYDLSAE